MKTLNSFAKWLLNFLVPFIHRGHQKEKRG